MSIVRQNYHPECEAAVNEMIYKQLSSSYIYLAMAFHFDRDDVALKGFHQYYMALSNTKREHALLFLKYQNERGGRIKLSNVPKPTKDDWGNGADSMATTLEAEKGSNASYIDLYSLAEKHGDEQLADYVEDNFLEKQTQLLKELGDHITNLKRAGPGLGEYQFNANLS